MCGSHQRKCAMPKSAECKRCMHRITNGVTVHSQLCHTSLGSSTPGWQDSCPLWRYHQGYSELGEECRTHLFDTGVNGHFSQNSLAFGFIYMNYFDVVASRVRKDCRPIQMREHYILQAFVRDRQGILRALDEVREHANPDKRHQIECQASITSCVDCCCLDR